MRKVAVVVAHADDEVLGCGGTMAKHSAAGDTIHVIYMTPSITSRKSDDERLDQERRRALAVIGNGDITFKVFDFADQMLDRMGQLKLARALAEELAPYNPDIIYTHSETDRNADHIAVCEAVLVVARQYCIPTESILSFEVLSSPPDRRGFIPNYFEDITGFIDRKCKAMKAYKSECRPPPHGRNTRAIRARAADRGERCCVMYAEAFVIQEGVGRKCH